MWWVLMFHGRILLSYCDTEPASHWHQRTFNWCALCVTLLSHTWCSNLVTFSVIPEHTCLFHTPCFGSTDSPPGILFFLLPWQCPHQMPPYLWHFPKPFWRVCHLLPYISKVSFVYLKEDICDVMPLCSLFFLIRLSIPKGPEEYAAFICFICLHNHF